MGQSRAIDNVCDSYVFALYVHVVVFASLHKAASSSRSSNIDLILVSTQLSTHLVFRKIILIIFAPEFSIDDDDLKNVLEQHLDVEEEEKQRNAESAC